MNGEVQPTFREACRAFNLLDDESHIIGGLETAAMEYSANQGRKLFATVVTHCHPGDPQGLFQRFEEFFSEDYVHRGLTNIRSRVFESIDLHLTSVRSPSLRSLGFTL